MALYDIHIVYKGKRVILHSDPDQFVWINSNGVCWEGEEETPFTLEEKIEFLRDFGKNYLTPIPGGAVPSHVSFLDGQDKYRYYGGYGLSILFDENKEPLYRIEDGKILSTQIICICEEKYAGTYRLRSKAEYDACRAGLVASGVFTELPPRTIKQGLFHRCEYKFYEYKCNYCGHLWSFPKPVKGYDAVYGLSNMTRRQQYLEQMSEQRKEKRKKK
ncbi:MAG: hypothetical protein J6Y08_09350 [Clostridiales bacterium]|nr:hypothetical protein [Clostridiales bacterium]